MTIVRIARRMAARTRDAIDMALHPRRRDKAHARLRARSARSALFVCLGNVCRSPYAEYVAVQRASEEIAMESAGFIGPGRQPPEAALRVARSRGVSHAEHRSRVITPELVSHFDVVFIFDRLNIKRLRGVEGLDGDAVFWLGDFDPLWEGRRAIVDPWGKDDDEFVRVFTRIERCVGEVLGILADEVPDPPTALE